MNTPDPDTVVTRPETDTERYILLDPSWIRGLEYGEPRPGHPEGKVLYHVRDVLKNVDEVAINEEDRRRLRLVALVHDNFKYVVDRSIPRTGTNHHSWLARKFAERYMDDAEVLEVIETHDEAFLAYKQAVLRNRPEEGRRRALRLIDRLGPSVPFYLRFFKADNGTEGKLPASREWFEKLVRESWEGVLP